MTPMQVDITEITADQFKPDSLLIMRVPDGHVEPLSRHYLEMLNDLASQRNTPIVILREGYSLELLPAEALAEAGWTKVKP